MAIILKSKLETSLGISLAIDSYHISLNILSRPSMTLFFPEQYRCNHLQNCLALSEVLQIQQFPIKNQIQTRILDIIKIFKKKGPILNIVFANFDLHL